MAPTRSSPTLVPQLRNRAESPPARPDTTATTRRIVLRFTTRGCQISIVVSPPEELLDLCGDVLGTVASTLAGAASRPRGEQLDGFVG